MKWGVISTANIGRKAVIPAIQASNNGEVIAVASRDLKKAQEFAGELDIPRSYSSYEELFEDADIDAVYNPLPNIMHREWTIKAAEAGKHILCEKPLAMNVGECVEMEDAARSNGVKLMEAFMYRFHPRTERVLEMVRAGELGQVKMINAAFTFRLTNLENIRYRPELGGGSLMDVGCYCVNIIRTIAGGQPAEVQAFARWSVTGVDERMVGSLRFENNLLAQFDCALNMERRELYQVAGTDAYMDVAGAFLPGEGITQILVKRGREEDVTYTLDGADEYQIMVEHFSDCVVNDIPVRYSPSEAAANMQVIEALYRSAKNDGKPEILP
jgi:predicted dehydrogenase